MPSIMDQNEYLKDVISSECSFYSAIRIPTISYCPCFLDIALSSSFLCSCRLSSAFLPACWSEREFGIASSSAHSFGPFVCTSFSALAALGCFPDLVPAAALGPSDLVCSSGPPPWFVHSNIFAQGNPILNLLTFFRFVVFPISTLT